MSPIQTAIEQRSAVQHFDPAGVSAAFGLGDDEVPVMLIAVGHPLPGNAPQKPRRAVDEVLSTV